MTSEESKQAKKRKPSEEHKRGNPACSFSQPHRQADALFLDVDADDFDFDNVADLHHVERVFDKLVGKLGDVHKAVLMDTDVDERTEVDDVADRTL